MPRVYDKDGNRVRARQRTAAFVDLAKAPRFDDALPENMTHSLVVISAKDGQPMVALVNPTLIATTEEVLERIDEARQVYVDAGRERDAALAAEVQRINEMSVKTNALDANQSALISQQQTLLAALSERKIPVPLGNLTVPASALTIALAGEKTVANLDVAGLKKTDAGNLLLTPQTLPSGYGLRAYSIPADGKLTLVLQCPALAVGGTALVFAVQAYRAS